MRMGRPGLLGTVGRTAVIAGTATMTANAVNRHGQHRAGGAAGVRREPGRAVGPGLRAASAGTPETDLVSQLARLARLRDAGVLTKEEFHTAKAELLSG